MKWIAIVVVALIVVIAVVAFIGSTLPRNHTASRTLRVKRSPGEVWPVVTQAMNTSSVPVDVLESDPPRRLVTRVKESEKMFGGTWTVTATPADVGATLTIVEDGWVANPVFRFVSRYVMGHHATMDAILTSVAKTLGEPVELSGE
jgi:hypothetical protein